MYERVAHVGPYMLSNILLDYTQTLIDGPQGFFFPIFFGKNRNINDCVECGPYPILSPFKKLQPVSYIGLRGQTTTNEDTDHNTPSCYLLEAHLPIAWSYKAQVYTCHCFRFQPKTTKTLLFHFISKIRE